MRTTTVTWSPAEGWSTDLASIPGAPGSSVALAFVDPQVVATAPLAEVAAALPGTTVIACSTAGQILGQHIDPAPLVLAVTTFEHAHVRSAFVPQQGRSSGEMGAALGAELVAAADGRTIAGVMVFGGGLDINGSALVAGLVQALPGGTALSGGLAADGARFEHTWVYCDGQSGEDCITAFAVIGESVRFVHGSQGGWDGFGPARTITRSKDHVLYELDGQPALALYTQYLGERAEDLPGSAVLFPLTVSSPDGSTRVVRTILSVDEADHSMTFAGDVPQGWTARLMWTTAENLIEGATEAAEDAAQEHMGLAVAVSCVGRRLVLGHRTDEELEGVVDVIGADTPLVGFYSYGEITTVDGFCALHNQTMTITTIREDLRHP